MGSSPSISSSLASSAAKPHWSGSKNPHSSCLGGSGRFLLRTGFAGGAGTGGWGFFVFATRTASSAVADGMPFDRAEGDVAVPFCSGAAPVGASARCSARNSWMSRLIARKISSHCAAGGAAVGAGAPGEGAGAAVRVSGAGLGGTANVEGLEVAAGLAADSMRAPVLGGATTGAAVLGAGAAGAAIFAVEGGGAVFVVSAIGAAGFAAGVRGAAGAAVFGAGTIGVAAFTAD